MFTDFDVQQPPKTVVVTYGRLTAAVLTAAGACAERPGILLLERLRPYDAVVDLMAELGVRGVQKLVFCEEGILSGGEGMNLASALRARKDLTSLPAMRILAIEAGERVPEPEVGECALDAAGIGVDHIINAICE